MATTNQCDLEELRKQAREVFWLEDREFMHLDRDQLEAFLDTLDVADEDPEEDGEYELKRDDGDEDLDDEVFDEDYIDDEALISDEDYEEEFGR